MKNEQLEKAIVLLRILREDAVQALDGTWDCTTQEGINTGFDAQIELIDRFLNEIK